MTVEAVTHPESGALWTGSGPAPAARPPVSMIERMTLILDAFDGSTPTLTLLGLSERTGLPRSTVHRILDQMIRLRWLAHAPGGYRLGLRTLELGGLAADHNEIRDVVSPLLHDLCQRTGMVGHLGVLDGREVLYLDKAGGRFAANVPTRLGGRMPAHSTALGKALLASLEPSIVETSFRDRLPQLTARTICDRTDLHRELGKIRQRQGVAVDNEESVAGIACVAVPIRGRGAAVAALSLSAHLDGDRKSLDTTRLARVLIEVAHEAGRSLFPRHARWR
ncbi:MULTISPECIES: IclR family transcriptional regulator [Nocardia]|uniref:IclR family transcriptional regulator n=1 Tax=Nocardia vulneris TaxID=1141657 RepID=A0ABR4ZC85_9NOCA|nr:MULTISPECIES: IclR family transcriptional regulator [Nocardia]ASF07955.1 IclR family transcriptional regulator [Nocardia brasiliensis]KIA62614.1 IclR family transcriptional regulator [Nocardia vulneris]GAJ84744.1 putative IclR family transcriptional regulator [Nocardia brasiliensis NBRC 14402]SUB54430.1 Pectin degradation repressor protein kdgR [Nocardia brasiliensis]